MVNAHHIILTGYRHWLGQLLICRRQAGFVAIVLACVCVCAFAPHTAEGAAAFPTDEQVEAAIRRGLDYLFGRVHPAGKWQSKSSNFYPGSVESLVALTAATAGDAHDKARAAVLLAHRSGIEPLTVYGRALRAMVYATQPGQIHTKALAADVKWLLDQRHNGGWGYGPGHPTTQLRPDWTDNSNSQWAVLALSEASAAGASVPAAVWPQCASYWQKAQNADGGWGFEPSGNRTVRLRPDSYGTMTAAGVATVLALVEKAAMAEPAFNTQTPRKPSACPYQACIAGGLKWLQEHYSVEAVPGWVYGQGDEWLYYYLYTLARALNAAGRRTLAGRDWYAEMASKLLAAQRPDGSWGVPADGGEPTDPIVRTCFALLCLGEGRRPVLINRLSLSPQPQRDCRDAANIARWFSRQFDRPVTWQLLSPADADLPAALADAPILYVNESGEATFSESLKLPLRKFILNGGTILIQPFGCDKQFSKYARKFFGELFPEFRQMSLPASHPLYRAQLPISPNERPKAHGLADNLRTRIIILESDLSGPWHQNRWKSSFEAFYFAANLAYYTTDRRPPPGKLTVRRPQVPLESPQRWITIARVRHRGDWNVCPQAIDRLSRMLIETRGIGVREAEAVDLRHEVPQTIELLWITGLRSPNFGTEQIGSLKSYVEKGGTVFIDSAIGKLGFFAGVRLMLRNAFGDEALKELQETSPLITGQFAGGIGNDIRKVTYSHSVVARWPRLREPRLWAVERAGRIAVVVSQYGVSCPVEGIPTFGCQGLSTRDARKLAANVALYAVMGTQNAASQARPKTQ